MGLFPNSTILMQRAEYSWINSGNGPNDNVNQLTALARKLLGLVMAHSCQPSKPQTYQHSPRLCTRPGTGMPYSGLPI